MVDTKRLKCHNCGAIKELPADIKEWGCLSCGAVNEVPQYSDTADEACTCLAPPRWAGWAAPAGVHEAPGEETLYKTAQGTWLTEEQYIQQLGLKPSIVLEAMRELGRKGKKGHFNCSMLDETKRRAK